MGETVFAGAGFPFFCAGSGGALGAADVEAVAGEIDGGRHVGAGFGFEGELLFGRHLVVGRMDHGDVSWVLKVKNPTGRMGWRVG